jgi:adenylyltransferase/sulfurtransferase
MKFRELKLDKDPNCPICGHNPVIRELIDYEMFCGLKPSKEEGSAYETIAPLDLKKRMDSGERLQIIDIREPHERAIAKFPGSVPIPLGQMKRRASELNPSIDTVFICKIGTRSVFAIRALRETGFAGNIFNLQDGINGWARDVDKSLPRY